MASLPDAVAQLVRTFTDHIEQYTSDAYNETQLRIDFINPMFEALKWDMVNKAGFAEAFRQVVHEDAVRIQGTVKSPDYSFRIGGRRIFFLEAKKPAVNIRDDPDPAYQLRRYAWTAGLPLSILTNFEEFAVYDCRVKPKYLEKASTARLWYFTYTEYAQRWDEIASIFSPEAIQHGAFDRYIKSHKKSGTQEFDDAFLDEMEDWRKKLAGNLALRNSELDQPGLNFATQRIIDRIIFLRICEDRGIETPFRLQALLSGENTYARLRESFGQADQRYNSGLFHFRKEKDRHEPPDELTLGLEIDDATLKQIIKRLYYPDSPYVFKEVAADILGSVYERFLGNVIHLTAGHHAKIEPKPEVRKAGGVYYTPTYIVDYIVQNTVGKLLDGKTPTDAAKLRVLDPACGSGSFLLGAYQHLLDWHQQWYLANDSGKWSKGKNPTLRPGPGGHLVLSIRERKRILIANIYGVDLDPQAVEVTKLSLLLKCLEGESAQSIDDLILFHERALPDLGDNIKCGNSLISTDFYAVEAWKHLSQDERSRIRPFNWGDEFSAVTKAGGFDIVIGNPPYVRMEEFVSIKDYLRGHYESHEERTDLYVYFLERGIGLLRQNGLMGEIVSNKFIKAKYGLPLRRFLTRNAEVTTIADFAGANVFRAATVRTAVLILRRDNKTPESSPTYVPVPDPDTLSAISRNSLTLSQYANSRATRLPSNSLRDDGWQLSSKDQSALLDKLRGAGVALCEFLGTNVLFGVKTGLNEAFIVDAAVRQAILARQPKAKSALRPILFGKDVRRYAIAFAARYVIYLHPGLKLKDYPAIRTHLEPYRAMLTKRAGPQAWFELQQPAVSLLQYTRKAKIVYPIIANECRFALDRNGHLVNDKTFILPSDDRALLGILNSRVGNFYFGSVCAALEGATDRYLEFRAQYVDLFPLPIQIRDTAAHDCLVHRVDQMLSLQKTVAAVQSPANKESLQREIDATDRQIDQLVYELYGLTDEEIRLVEEAGQ